jgi:hypothetical protein
MRTMLQRSNYSTAPRSWTKIRGSCAATVERSSFAVGIAIGAVASIALVGCGSNGPSVTQLRDTVRRYLSATTPAERCQLFTTVYRTENPDVLFSGGCLSNQQITPAEEAARRTLRIARVDVHGEQASVALASGVSSASPGSSLPNLTALDLKVEGGLWRIDGLTERAQGSAVSR